MSYSDGWPYQKPVPGVDARSGARSAKLAITQRMELLARVPLFAGLSKRQRQAMARVCSIRCWPAESRVVVEGSKDQFCFIIVDGTVDVHRAGKLIAQLGPGEFFGEIELLDPGSRSATVTTTTEVMAVELSRKAFVDVAAGDPQLLLGMLKVMARRVRQTTEKASY